MNKAIIFFSGGETLKLTEGDIICPVCKGTFLDTKNKKILEEHITDGLIPSIFEVISNCDYFTVQNQSSTIYFTNTIVKITDGN